VEITNKIIKNATTKQFHYDFFSQLKAHLMTFVLYYNHQRLLKSLKLKTPWGSIIEWYQKEPLLFKQNPHHKIVGLNR